MTTDSPLVDHFKLDALGLDSPSEATVATVDAEFELLLEFYAGKNKKWLEVRVCTGFYLVCACAIYVCSRGGYSTTLGPVSTSHEVSLVAMHPTWPTSSLVSSLLQEHGTVEPCCCAGFKSDLGIQTHALLLALQLLHPLNRLFQSMFLVCFFEELGWEPRDCAC